ncbi:hypothetical protein HU727_015115 [Pseudomonas sp. SWRI153]|uniref:Uncharacterized protein n=1 Tax=Pseudomonas khorasanensis TaxID=2745508 RepID=A0A923F7N9_9PSED|nr:hypothetical protein [Pseudomonas khorasanensis]MBV4486923.1 hypothetical protein [Pseudomonas khorasanensis]
MKSYARIVDNVVVELFSTEGNMAEMFHPDLVWVDITEIAPAPQIDWTANFGTLGWVFASPEAPAPVSPLKTLANKWLAGIRAQA